MTWRAARDYAIPVLAICLVVAGILALAMAGCAPTRSAADVEKCIAAADARAELEIARRCETDTFAECPHEDEIMAEWEAEARRCR